MKKILGVLATLIFGGFGVGIIGLMASLSYAALGYIFPTSTEKQMWGMVIADIAVIAWAFGFAFRSKSIPQYGAAAAGFLVGLIGTLGLVAAEVILGGQQLIPAQRQEIGRWMIYGFIAVSIIHVLLLWMHHGSAPEMWQQIELGAARAQITDTARAQATRKLETESNQLATHIADQLVNDALRELNIPIPANNTVFDPHSYQQVAPLPYPTQQPAIDWAYVNEKLEQIKNDLKAAAAKLAEPIEIPSFLKSDPNYYPKPEPKKDEPIPAQSPFPN